MFLWLRYINRYGKNILLKYLMFYSLFKDTDLEEHIYLSSRNTFFIHAGALFFLFCLFAQRKRNVKIQRHTET